MSYLHSNPLRRGGLWLPAVALCAVMSFAAQIAPAAPAADGLRNFEKVGRAPAVGVALKSAPVPPRVTSVMLAVVDDSWTGFANGTVVNVGSNFTIGTDAFATIQDGIDALSAGGTVKVLPGTYNETAAGRFLFDATGPYQFGLFIGAAQPGVTVQGVDGSGIPIGSAGAVAAFVTTNATNSFGTSGVFIEGDGVTISGLSIGVNIPGTNKTIEVIGNAFTLQNSVVADAEGSVYLNDWRFDVGTDTSHLQSYAIQGNIFQAGNSIDIASGAGYSGPTAGRVISGNSFTNVAGEFWPAISFNGSGTGVPWFVYSVGGAVITGNTFTNTDATGQNIRARGTYDNTQFDWAGYFNANTYDRATIVGAAPPAIVRTYSYVSGPYTFNTVRRVGAPIQPEVDHAAAGDIVLAKAGTYEEQVVISTNGVTLQGAGLASTTVKSPVTLTAFFNTGPNNFPVVFVNGATGVTVRDLTVDGAGRGNANYRFQGVSFWNGGGKVEAVAVTNVAETPFNGNQHGVGVYANNNTGGPYTLEVSNVTVTSYQKNAMALSGAGLTVNVHDCSTTGVGPTAVTAQNGIQVGFGAGGSVTNCSVADVRYTPAGTTATGLLFYQGTTVNVTGSNVVTNCQSGIYYQDTNGAASGCSVTGSTWGASLYNNQLTLAKGDAGPGETASNHAQALPFTDDMPAARAGLPGTAVTLFTVALSNNCILGSDATGSVGVDVWSRGGGLNVSLSNLELSDWDEAIVAAGPVAVTAQNNSITSNLTAGFDNQAPQGPQNAEFNWWGAAGGPAGGNAVLGANVDSYPWLSTGADVNAGCGFTPVTLSVNTVTPVAPATCISTVNPCVTVAVNIARADAIPMRGFSADIQLSPNLELCTSGSITEGSYLSSVLGSTTHFQVVPNGPGSYTIDCAILGLPCGATAASGNLFNIAVKNSGGDGTGTVTVTSVIARDCPNAPISVIPGAPASITIDNTLPDAIANLNAVQVKSGNDTDGTTEVTVTFTAVGAASVEVYRAWYGTALVNAYPEYNDAAGAGVPATPGSYPPAAPWVLTGVTATGQADEVGSRGFWYYVAYVKDACGNVSPVSNKTAGTLNYHLGDVSPVTGNNTVTTTDISHLGSHYGITLVLNDTYNHLDVGPTSNFTVDALPTTDNRVQFEDLIMFAINYGQVSKSRVTPAPSAADELMVLVPETADEGMLLAHLWIRGTGRIQGLSAHLAWNAEVVEPVGLEAGSFLRDQGGVAFTPEPGTADVALLGTGTVGLAGEGELAVVRFRVKQSGDPAIRIAGVEARDARNTPVEMGTRSGGVSPEANLPRVTALLANVPNPFNPTTRIPFTLSARGQVEVGVYTVDGRKVRTLLQGMRDAGLYETTWDGTDERGVRLASGAYYVRLLAGGAMQSRPIVMVK